MGTKYEVWAWISTGDSYEYQQTWGGQSIVAAVREALRAKRAGAGCIRLEWRG